MDRIMQMTEKEILVEQGLAAAKINIIVSVAFLIVGIVIILILALMYKNEKAKHNDWFEVFDMGGVWIHVCAIAMCMIFFLMVFMGIDIVEYYQWIITPDLKVLDYIQKLDVTVR